MAWEGTESGNWNVAKHYPLIKIMNPLAELDELEKIATFGTAGILEDFTTSQEDKNKARVQALRRYAVVLDILIGNALFAIKKKEDRKFLEDCLTEVENYGEYIKVTEVIKYDQRDKRNVFRINERFFDIIFSKLKGIKRAINEPLNNNDLIFTQPDDFDPDEYVEKIMQDFEKGG